MSSSSSRKRKGTLDSFVVAKKRLAAEPSGDTPSPTKTTETWKTNGSSLLYRWGAVERPCVKVACFDLDGTLVNTKGRSPFPRNADDWVFFNEHVTPKLKQLHEQEFRLVIFSNQGGIKSRLTGALASRHKARINRILEEVELPMDVFLATMTDEFRKPETGMWNFFMEEFKKDGEVDMESSFFVGDAAGRPGDFSDSDKIFAANIGISFLTPEQIFDEPSNSSAPGADEEEKQQTAMNKP